MPDSLGSVLAAEDALALGCVWDDVATVLSFSLVFTLFMFSTNILF